MISQVMTLTIHQILLVQINVAPIAKQIILKIVPVRINRIVLPAEGAQYTIHQPLILIYRSINLSSRRTKMTMSLIKRMLNKMCKVMKRIRLIRVNQVMMRKAKRTTMMNKH